MFHKKKILIISYHFPPVAGVKIQRVVKLIKYIGEFGFEPIVLAPRGEVRHGVDPESLDEVKEYCEIHRALILDILRPLFAIRNWVRGKRQPSAKASASSMSRPRTIARKLVTLLLFPDSAILWLLPALVVGYRLIQRKQIDLIFSTSPPFSSHLIARLLAKLTRKPFVVDLRDLWVDNPFVQQPTTFHLRVGQRLERMILHKASGITCATCALENTLRRSYGNEIGTKTVVIFNGYDPADFEVPISGDTGEFTVIHGGSVLLASGRDHQPLTSGMIRAMQRADSFRRHARLSYFGFMDGENLANLRRLQTKSGFADRIEYLGPISHQRAIETMRKARVLVFLGGHEIDSTANLLTTATEKHSVAAKLFEYLACEKPILLIAGECPTVELALKCGVGYWCSSYDPERVADWLLDLYDRFYIKTERVSPNREVIACFSRRKQAREFSKVFMGALR